MQRKGVIEQGMEITRLMYLVDKEEEEEEDGQALASNISKYYTKHILVSTWTTGGPKEIDRE